MFIRVHNWFSEAESRMFATKLRSMKIFELSLATVTACYTDSVLEPIYIYTGRGSSTETIFRSTASISKF